MASTVTTSQLDGYFKRVYGKFTDLIPRALYIQNETPLREADKIGESFNVSVLVEDQNGATVAGPDSGAFDLNEPRALTTKRAFVNGSQIVNRGLIDYESAAKAVADGSKAFGRATRLIVQQLYNNTRNRLEVMNLYGQSDSGIGVATSSANASATTTVVTLTAASWASGIWNAFQGVEIEFRELGNLSNLVSSGADSVFVVTAVDIANKAITVTGTAAGITALDADIAAGGGTDQAIFFRGGFAGDFAGIDKIVTNTGTLFGIDSTAFQLWKGNTVTVSGAFTVETGSEAVSVAASRGLDSDVTALVSPGIWAKMLTDQAALRRYSNDVTKEMKNGARSISFYTQTGTIEYVAHKFVKDGDVFILPFDGLKRIGATDVTFSTPGHDGEIFRQLESKAGFEFRAYSNQAIIHEAPATATKVSWFTLP